MKQVQLIFGMLTLYCATKQGAKSKKWTVGAAVWWRNAALLAANGTSTRLPRCEFGELFLSVFITYQGHWPSPSPSPPRSHHRHDGRGGIDLTDGDLFSDNSLVNICHCHHRNTALSKDHSLLPLKLTSSCRVHEYIYTLSIYTSSSPCLLHFTNYCCSKVVKLCEYRRISILRSFYLNSTVKTISMQI